MKILGIRTIEGPNVFTHAPILVMKLDLEKLTDVESSEVPGFVDRLLNILPGLRTHRCSRGYEGGLVERLNEGTYFGHIVEHVALELSGPVGIESGFGKTVYAGRPGLYNVVVEYVAEEGMKFLLRTAVDLVDAMVKGAEYPLEEQLAEAKEIVATTELGPSTRAIVEAARKRRIPTRRIGKGSLVQFGYGRNRKFIQASIGHDTPGIAVDISCDKELTKTLLEEASLPVPEGVVVGSEDEAVAAFEEIGGSVVVKPADGRQGKGVSCGLTTKEQVIEAFRIAREYSRDVLVEELFVGHDYRLLVVDGKLVAAAERRPPQVVADGVHTILELVEMENQNPLRGEGHERPLTCIPIDAILEAHLKRDGYELSDIPIQGTVITLREGANLSTGGTAHDVTDQVHPSIARICVRAAALVGLDICGVDLMTTDITRSLGPKEGIIEVNAAPGLRMHCFPSHGQARDVGGAIVDMLYPPGTSARIPIVSVTGTNGKTTVTRLIGYLLGCFGRRVGITTTDGIYLNHECIAKGDTTGPRSARTILSDPSVEVAVLETARGGMMRSGLAYDWSDVGVITNIQPDHIGQDGIRDVDDIVHVKSLVAERVRRGGTLILNADDPNTAKVLARRAVRADRKKIVYFSLDPANEIVARHTAEGGTAFVEVDGWIVERCGEREEQIVLTSSISITLDGLARYHVANALAAIAACRAFGVPGLFIASCIQSFQSDRHNPGRTNIYRVGSGHVVIDYGHNPDALGQIAEMAGKITGRPIGGIIAAPGDRAEELIGQVGRAAARGFQRIIVKEDHNLRGRGRGETATILYRAVKEERPDRDCIVILDETEAVLRGIQEMRPGEILFIFYDKFDPVMEILSQMNAVPVSSLHQFELATGENDEH